MLEELFDIKNDKRLSMYLYRMGFGMWLAYIVLGAPALRTYLHYRTDCGVFAFLFMILSFSASMVYDYVHDRTAFETKKKWLVIGYMILAIAVYLLEFRPEKGVTPLDWLFTFCKL